MISIAPKPYRDEVEATLQDGLYARSVNIGKLAKGFTVNGYTHRYDEAFGFEILAR